MVKNKTLKVPLIFPILTIILFFVAVTISTINYEDATVATFETKIDTVTIDGSIGAYRAEERYAKGKSISTSEILIENKDNFTNWSGGAPIISFSSKPYVHRLSDLGVPYTIFKKANSDAIEVFKDRCHLKFLIIDEENKE